MKKNIILWMSTLVLTIVGLSGCSNENDNTIISGTSEADLLGNSNSNVTIYG